MNENYLKFWNIEEPIFQRFLPKGKVFLNDHLSKLWKHILILVEQNQTLTIISGGPGRGKTLLTHWIYGILDPMTHECYMTSLSKNEALPGGFLSRLNEFLIGKSELNGSRWNATAEGFNQLRVENRHLVLIIDAAEQLQSPEALEDIIYLYNLSRTSQQAFSLLLVGDSTLWDRIKISPELRVRISLLWNVPPLNEADTLSYISWYVQLSGLTFDPFDREAKEKIYYFSQGIPAIVNLIAENCLIEAFLLNIDTVNVAIIENVIQMLKSGSNRKAEQKKERSRQSKHNQVNLNNRNISSKEKERDEVDGENLSFSLRDS